MIARVQLSRKRGWRKPANTIVVARPTRWGNPYSVATLGSRQAAVDAHRAWLPHQQHLDPADLAGKNLACWCPLSEPCHADTLIEWANQKSE
jgi:Domain of unknown function (DUF4326)